MKRRTDKNVFHSPLAGSWYTSDPEQLKAEIDGYIDKADGERIDDLIALILPHAGYAYSGATAGFGIAQLKGRDYERVIVLGPTHRFSMRNIISMPTATHYATPLGEVSLDTAFMNALSEKPFAVRDPHAHSDEHSVQIEIPLLQRVLDDFKLVPIVCGQVDLETARDIGAALHAMIDDKTLLVVSSDFTHYGPRFGYTPFREDLPSRIEKLDMGAFKEVEAKDMKAFAKYIDDTGATICGRNPISVLLAMLPATAEASLLKYDSSGRMTGDYGNTVSYISAAVSGSWEDDIVSDGDEKPRPAAKSELSESDRESLLRLARETLTSYIETGKRPAPEDLDIDISTGMRQVMGAFVTLHKDGRLRGCIGEIAPRRPLYQAVADHAVNSAVNDHRFPPVKADETDKLQIEISALTPPRQVDSYNDIEIGKHGVVLQKGLRGAVFLPQVAPEQGWGIEETLTHLAMKAGLPPDGWRKDTEFEVFEAIVFSENLDR